jgi:hypothetical protein
MKTFWGQLETAEHTLYVTTTSSHEGRSYNGKGSCSWVVKYKQEFLVLMSATCL